MAWTNQSSSSAAGSGALLTFEEGATLASAATVTLTDSYHQISGTTQVDNFAFSSGSPRGLIFIRPTGAWPIGTGGNIKNAPATATADRVMAFLYDGTNYRYVGVFDNTNTLSIKDTLFRIQDDGDTTKQIAFQASGITTGTTRTITAPDSNTTLPIASQILTLAGPTAARTITLPDGNTTVPSASQLLTFAGPTASRTITLPDANITVARTDAANSFTGNQTLADGELVISGSTKGVKERGRSTALGEWTAVTHSAGNFTASGSMTFTVDSGDQLTYAYTLIGKTMILAIRIDSASVGGTPSTDLRVAIPGGFTAAKSMQGTYRAYNNGVSSAGLWTVSASAAYVAFSLIDIANWTASTNNTGIFATVQFEVS